MQVGETTFPGWWRGCGSGLAQPALPPTSKGSSRLGGGSMTGLSESVPALRSCASVESLQVFSTVAADVGGGLDPNLLSILPLSGHPCACLQGPPARSVPSAKAQLEVLP